MLNSVVNSFRPQPLSKNVWKVLCVTYRSLEKSDTDQLTSLTLFGLVSQSAGFIGSSGSRSPVKGGQLTVLPAPHTEQKSHHIRLLLPP